MALAAAGCAGPGRSQAPWPASRTVPAGAAAACTAAALRITAGREGENGGAHGDIEFTNTGGRPCVLRGMPAVSILRASGAPLPVRQVPADGVTIRPVTLPPGGRGAADLVVFWANWCGQRPGPLLVRIAMPGGGQVTGPFNGPPGYDYVPRCLSPGQPSEISVISAYRPAPAQH